MTLDDLIKKLIKLAIWSTVIFSTFCSIVLGLEYVFQLENREPLNLSLTGMCLLPLCLWLGHAAWQGWRSGRGTQRRVILKSVSALLLAIIVIASCSLFLVFQQSQVPFRELAKAGCLGTRVSHAAIYPGESTFHPIIFLDKTGEQNGWTPRAYTWHWQPTEPEHLQLVACIDEVRKGIETCHYTGGGVANRYQNTAQVKLIALSTGTLIAEKDFSGSLPSTCPTSVTTSRTDYVGGNISDDEVKAWLAPYVGRGP